MEAFVEMRERIARARTDLIYAHLAPAIALATGLPQPPSLPDYTASVDYDEYAARVVTLNVGEGSFTQWFGGRYGSERAEIVGVYPRAVEETFLACIALFSEHALGHPETRSGTRPQDRWDSCGDAIRSIARQARWSESEMARDPARVPGPAVGRDPGAEDGADSAEDTAEGADPDSEDGADSCPEDTAEGADPDSEDGADSCAEDSAEGADPAEDSAEDSAEGGDSGSEDGADPAEDSAEGADPESEDDAGSAEDSAEGADPESEDDAGSAEGADSGEDAAGGADSAGMPCRGGFDWSSGDEFDDGFSDISGSAWTRPIPQPTRRQVAAWMSALGDFAGNTWGLFPFDDLWQEDAARRLCIWAAPVPTDRAPVATLTAQIAGGAPAGRMSRAQSAAGSGPDTAPA